MITTSKSSKAPSADAARICCIVVRVNVCVCVCVCVCVNRKVSRRMVHEVKREASKELSVMYACANQGAGIR